MPSEVRVVIPSRKRHGYVSALKLFPDATLCVGEDEEADYRAAYPDVEIVTHPSDVLGMGPLRQWILDNIHDEKLLMVDDDVTDMVALTMGYKQYNGPDAARSVIESAASCAKAAGAHVWGFNQAWDVRKFTPLKPFSFNTWVSAVIGVVGRRPNVRFDPQLKLRCDIDFCLQSLKVDRILWADLRFSFIQKRFTGDGGNAVNRSADRHAKEIAYIKSKWGQWVTVRKTKTVLRIVTKVER